jgi:hypothetical protein
MTFLDDIADVGRLRAELHRTTRAATAASDERAMADLITTGCATVLRIEAELARRDRELEACLADGPLDDVPGLVRRRRALLLARTALRGDLRQLASRRRALQLTAAEAAPAPRRDPRRPAS